MYTYIEEKKFKTNQIKLYFIVDDYYDIYRLLPGILFNGSKNYPSKKIINNYFEDLFDASCSLTFRNIGKLMVFQVTATYLKDKYANFPTTKSIINIIKDIIYNPLLVNGFFKEEIIENEKRMLIEILKEEKDRKLYYAIKQNMLNNSIEKKYKLAYFTNIETIENITKEDLKLAYDNLINNAKLKVYLNGEIDLSLIDFESSDVELIATDNLMKNVEEREIIEEIDANQTIMTINYLTNKSYLDKENRSLSLLTHLLGGDANSILFRKVREQANLCYYINMHYDNFSGGCLINLGLDSSNIEMAKSLIKECIDDVINKNYDDSILENAKLSLKDGILDSLDDQNLATSRKFFDDLYQREDVFTVIKSYEKINKDDLSKAASLLKLDLIYILKGVSNESN